MNNVTYPMGACYTPGGHQGAFGFPNPNAKNVPLGFYGKSFSTKCVVGVRDVISIVQLNAAIVER